MTWHMREFDKAKTYPLTATIEVIVLLLLVIHVIGGIFG